ncbi:MAG: YajQ family cyclic di-GMP-binding protein [Nitrospiraceae bacterium]|nr:YajQ family cyclic di-GMP-binding protein [Nitrospiraceae bacterium]
MASEASFDIVSKVDMQEAKNAVDQAVKEMGTRFDLKDSGSKIEWEKEDLVLSSKDTHKLTAVIDILESKMVRRGIPLKNLDKKKVEEALGGTVRQRIAFKQGLTQEVAKEIVKEIKGTKLKVQSQVQGDSVRVTGKSRDDLQAVIALLKGKDFGIDLQFTNYR